MTHVEPEAQISELAVVAMGRCGRARGAVNGLGSLRRCAHPLVRLSAPASPRHHWSRSGHCVINDGLCVSVKMSNTQRFSCAAVGNQCSTRELGCVIMGTCYSTCPHSGFRRYIVVDFAA